MQKHVCSCTCAERARHPTSTALVTEALKTTMPAWIHMCIYIYIYIDIDIDIDTDTASNETKTISTPIHSNVYHT
jgi:hypothetical protein